jgi:hypothetical protein
MLEFVNSIQTETVETVRGSRWKEQIEGWSRTTEDPVPSPECAVMSGDPYITRKKCSRFSTSSTVKKIQPHRVRLAAPIYKKVVK